MRADAVKHAADGSGRSEEEGARDAIDRDVAVGGIGPVRETVLAGAVGRIRGDERGTVFDLDGLGHAVQEKEGAERHADAYGDGEIGEDRQEEGRHQDSGVAPRRAQQAQELVPFGHVPGDDGEHASEARQGDVGGERCGQDHEQENVAGMEHAGDGTARAGADVRRRAGDGTGDAHPAEGHRGDIGGALGDKLAVGAVLSPAHAVGNHCRQQALDGAEQGDGDSIGEHGA